MTSQTVTFVETRETRHPFPRTDVFAFNPARKHLWLQRLCIWTLSRLGCHWMDDKIAYTKHVIDTGSMVERLFKQQSVIEEVFNHRANEVLIGSEDFAQLMGEPEIRQMVTIPGEYRVGNPSRGGPMRGSLGGGFTIIGLKVTVIPWMRGMLVMP